MYVYKYSLIISLVRLRASLLLPFHKRFAIFQALPHPNLSFIPCAGPEGGMVELLNIKASLLLVSWSIGLNLVISKL